MGAIFTTPPALVVELKCWLSSRLAMCQPSFTAIRLAPMPAFPQHNVPPGFPLLLAPFPNLRAQYVRMFGRFNHHPCGIKPKLPRTHLDSSSPLPTARSPRSSESSLPDAVWISEQKKLCRAELKHFEQLKQTWRAAAPFVEPYPEPQHASTNPRNSDSWVVCRLTAGMSDEDHDEASEVELVWPLDHCLLDLETWIVSSEQPSNLSDHSTPSTTKIPSSFPSRGGLANSLLLSAYEPTDRLAEDAGSYIDWVAQERELQRRAAAVAAGKDKIPQKTESPPPPPPAMSSTRVGIGYNRSRGSTYHSPRFQRHPSNSTRTSPIAPLALTPRSARKRSREDGEPNQPGGAIGLFPSARSPTGCAPLGTMAESQKHPPESHTVNHPPSDSVGHSSASADTLLAAVDMAANILNDPDIDFFFRNRSDLANLRSLNETTLPPPQPQPPDSTTTSRITAEDSQFQNPGFQSFASTALTNPNQLVNNSTLQSASAQQGSGSGSTASTLSHNTNLFEQPTPGSLSISGMTPGRLNGFTPDGAPTFNPPSVSAPVHSSPVNPNHYVVNPESSAFSHIDQVSLSENAFRGLSLMPSSGFSTSSTAWLHVEPVGYESVQFSDSHLVVDDHYIRRDGKYALPPSPRSFNGAEDTVEELFNISAPESIRIADGLKLNHVSKKLMRSVDPRSKAVRGLSHAHLISSQRTATTEPHSFSRVAPPMNGGVASSNQGGNLYGESPATPRSWVPIGSPNESPESSICSDDEDEPENDRFLRSVDGHRHRGSSSAPTTSSSSSDDENMIRGDLTMNKHQDGMSDNILRMERTLQRVLECQYRSQLSVLPTTSEDSDDLSTNQAEEHSEGRIGKAAKVGRKVDHPDSFKRFPKSHLKRKLKNWVSQLGAQLGHDPNLEVLLESVLPSSSSSLRPNGVSVRHQRMASGSIGESESVLDLASLPMIHGFDYYRGKMDDWYEIQEDRRTGRHQHPTAKKEEEGKTKDGKVVQGEAADPRPYLIKKFTKHPTSIIVKLNEGKQKIAFSLISQLFKYWIKLGFEPVSGQRNFTLSILFPKRPTRPHPSTKTAYSWMKKKKTQEPSSCEPDSQDSFQIISHASIEHWLLELAHVYKSCRFGELSIGKIHESQHKPGALKVEIEELIKSLKCSKMTRHTCLIVVDRLEDMKSLMVGESEIRGLDDRPVTRLMISRYQLIDNRPASLISLALRLYDSMKILVDRFKAPGLVLESYVPSSSTGSADPPIISPNDPMAPIVRRLNLVNSPGSLSDSEGPSDGEEKESCDRSRPMFSNLAEEDVDDTTRGELKTQDEIQAKFRRLRPESATTKLLSGHAFFLAGIPKPTQLNLRWPPSGIDVGARHRLLHTGYLVGPEKDWVLVSMVDELGQQHELKLKFLNVGDGGLGSRPRRHRNDHPTLPSNSITSHQQPIASTSNRFDRANRSDSLVKDESTVEPPHDHNDDPHQDHHAIDPEFEVVKSVYKAFRKIVLTTNVEWRIVITKLGKLKPVEYRAWSELLSQVLPTSELAFHVTLASVMLSDVPLLKRVPPFENLATTTTATQANSDQGEPGSDLEMGEVECVEEGEESNNGRSAGGGTNLNSKPEEDAANSVGGSDKIFGGPEPIWVSHESTIRPHSFHDDWDDDYHSSSASHPTSHHQSSVTSRRPLSVNETIVHSLSTSYLYHLDCPTKNGIGNLLTNRSGQINDHPIDDTSHQSNRNSLGSSSHYNGGRFRLDLLGTGSTASSVYQFSLFQHREEIVNSLVQLSKLKSLRMGLKSINNHHHQTGCSSNLINHLVYLPPQTGVDLEVEEHDDVDRDRARTNSRQGRVTIHHEGRHSFHRGSCLDILPVHLSCLKLIGDRLTFQFDEICRIFHDDDEEEDVEEENEEEQIEQGREEDQGGEEDGGGEKGGEGRRYPPPPHHHHRKDPDRVNDDR